MCNIVNVLEYMHINIINVAIHKRRINTYVQQSIHEIQ